MFSNVYLSLDIVTRIAINTLHSVQFLHLLVVRAQRVLLPIKFKIPKINWYFLKSNQTLETSAQ